MLVLFDIDGTLLLTGGAGKEVINDIFLSRYAFTRAMEGIRPHGKTDPYVIASVFQKFGYVPSLSEIDSILREYEALLPAALLDAPRFRVLPGALSLLSHLTAQGVFLGLATGNTVAGARAKLQRAGLWQFFISPECRESPDTSHLPIGAFGGDDASRGFLVRIAIERSQACFRRSFRLSEVLLVGDTPDDIQAARFAGVRVAAVSTGGHSRSELEIERPDLLLSSLQDLSSMFPFVDPS